MEPGPSTICDLRFAFGRWPVLICSERKVLLSGLLVVGLFSENITAVWWLISQTNRVLDSPLHPTASSNQQQLVLLHTFLYDAPVQIEVITNI
jgi:hypothetical protein